MPARDDEEGQRKRFDQRFPQDKDRMAARGRRPADRKRVGNTAGKESSAARRAGYDRGPEGKDQEKEGSA